MTPRKELIIPDSGDGNFISFDKLETYELEGIDNPRLRGRKLFRQLMKLPPWQKELIIPDSGDGNQMRIAYVDTGVWKELIIPDSGDGNK